MRLSAPRLLAATCWLPTSPPFTRTQLTWSGDSSPTSGERSLPPPLCVSFSVASSVVDSGSSYEFLEIRIRPILVKHIQLFFYLVPTRYCTILIVVILAEACAGYCWRCWAVPKLASRSYDKGAAAPDIQGRQLRLRNTAFLCGVSHSRGSALLWWA